MFGGLQAINVSSVSFAGLRKNNVAFTLQPVTQRFAVLRAVSSILLWILLTILKIRSHDSLCFLYWTLTILCYYTFEQAKKETVEKVCDIVKKQLVLPEGTDVTGASKFTDLGADSLDTVSQLDAISSSISFNYLALTSTCPEIAWCVVIRYQMTFVAVPCPYYTTSYTGLACL